MYNKLLGTTISDINGNYSFPVDRSVNYNIKVLKFNYETTSLAFTTFKTSGLNKVSQNINLKQLPVIKVKGTIADASNNLGIPNADVFILSDTDKVLFDFKTDEYGQYVTECQYNVTYKVKIVKDGYNAFSTELSTLNMTGLNAIVRNYEINPVPYFILKGIVKKGDSKSTPLESVHVQLFEVTNSTKSLLDIVTENDGLFSIKLTDRAIGSLIKLELILSKSGYVSKREVFKLQLNNIGEYDLSETLNLKLDLLQVGNDIGKVAQVKPIYFDYGKFNIKEEAAIELDKIVKILKDNPSIEIELGSHTDSRSSSKFNQNLSQKRAEASAQYIISKGVAQNRVIAKGYGESKLVNHCKDGVLCSETEHQENRRTEFIILKY
ncbi:MAG: OmpA family protein [Bacteroidales bacterium]|nr:OmpA family protein [Bacteroidales bacterium]